MIIKWLGGISRKDSLESVGILGVEATHLAESLREIPRHTAPQFHYFSKNYLSMPPNILNIFLVEQGVLKISMRGD